MKNYPRPARRVAARGFYTEPYAASAKERAIACSSMVTRLRWKSSVRSDGNARAEIEPLVGMAEGKYAIKLCRPGGPGVGIEGLPASRREQSQSRCLAR